jgi:hypothetical protein
VISLAISNKQEFFDLFHPTFVKISRDVANWYRISEDNIETQLHCVGLVVKYISSFENGL